MVRIFRVTELQARKQELLARSEIYRQTLALEVTNVRLGIALVKKQIRGLRGVSRLLSLAVPISGLLFGRRKKAGRKTWFLTQILSGINLATRLRGFFNGEKSAEPAPEEPESPTRH